MPPGPLGSRIPRPPFVGLAVKPVRNLSNRVAGPPARSGRSASPRLFGRHGRSQALAALGTPALQDGAARPCLHAFTESMLPESFDPTRLISSLHDRVLSLQGLATEPGPSSRPWPTPSGVLRSGRSQLAPTVLATRGFGGSEPSQPPAGCQSRRRSHVAAGVFGRVTMPRTPQPPVFSGSRPMDRSLSVSAMID